MPRRDACWPPRCWAGMTSVSGLCPLCRGQRGQAGSVGVALQEKRSPAKATTWRPATGRSAIPGPPARATNICRRMRRWLCWPASFTNCGPAGCGASLSFRRWRFPSSASCGNGWWPSRAQGLSRDLQVLGEGPKPFWMAAADASTSPALDVADVPAEFTFRAQEAREQTATTRWCNGRPGCCDPTPTRWPRTSIRCCARR